MNDFDTKNGILEKYLGHDKVVTIPYNVTSIGAWSFEERDFITEIIVPNSVTSIKYNAFCNCKSLKKIILPNSMISIDDGAFYNCTNLTEITIPDNIIYIGEDTFYGCYNLKKIVITDGITNGNINFEYLESLKNIPYTIMDNRVNLIKNRKLNLSQRCFDVLTTDNYTINFKNSPFSAYSVQLPFFRLSFLKIFTTDATPKIVFESIYNLLNNKDELLKAYINGKDFYKYIPNLKDYDNPNYFGSIYELKSQRISNGIKDNPHWIPNFITYYNYELNYNNDDNYDYYYNIDTVKGICNINLFEYAKTHNELYMFKLEILSAFIGIFGTTHETDIIIRTILDTTKILADNFAFNNIRELLTNDIYKNLWFNDDLKSKVNDLI